MNQLTPSKTLPTLTLDVSPVAYHKLGSDFDRGSHFRTMSNSQLKQFGRCPHKWFAGKQEEDTDALEWGSLIDCLVLTPKEFDTRYAICPETYPAEGKKKGDPTEQKPWNWNANHCKEWRTEKLEAGFQVVKSDWASEGWKATNRVQQDETLANFIGASDSQVQVCVDYKDQATGIVVAIKCLIDCVPRKGSPFAMWLGDLKTTNNASPRSWQKSVFEFGLHYQAALYLDAYNAVTGEDRHTFVHLVQESAPPYETARRMLAMEYLELGRLSYQSDLRDYCQCLASGEWPSYDDRETIEGDIINGWRVVEPAPWMVAA